MLYPAFPPAPPPIVITLRNQNVVDQPDIAKKTASVKPVKASIENGGNASVVIAENSICTSSETPRQKSDLVSNLLAKMLTASNQAKGQPVICISEKKKAQIKNLQVQIQSNKRAKSFSVIPPAKTSEPNNSPVTPEQLAASVTTKIPLENGANLSPSIPPTQLENKKLISALENNKSIQKNAIGKILSAVQELISISLYASVNNTVDRAVKPNINNSEQIAAGVSNSPEIIDDKKTEVNSNNSTNEEVASSRYLSTGKILTIVQELISASLAASLNTTIQDAVKPDIEKSGEIVVSPPPKISNSEVASSEVNTTSTPNNNKPETNSNNAANLQAEKIAVNNNNINSTIDKTTPSLIERLTGKPILQLAKSPDEPFLVGVLINGREVGTLDIIQGTNTLLIPLENFAEVAGFTIQTNEGNVQATTPLGVRKLPANSLRQINGITYITNAALQEELSIKVDLNTADLTLNADLPWRGNSRQNRPRPAELKPDFFAPKNGLSNYRQEFNVVSGAGDTSLRSSTFLGGRLLGGAWRLRLDNSFVDKPDISEYFFYKRNGRFRYQLGRQQVGLHPLLNGLDLTGLQLGYSNLPEESLNTSSAANEILPRRSRPIQTFSGKAPPASFVQLRVSGVVIAQQQIGFNGRYDFIDVNLPIGQSNQIEVLIYDRNNFRVPIEIRSVRISASDLLLPSGGNVQLAGLGFSGNLAQNGLFGDVNSSSEGKPVGFYQLRQGLSSNLTFEGSVQAAPESVQSQAGFIWRLANPIILSASVGSSEAKLGYSADLDIQLQRLEINANSQSLPAGYGIGQRNTQRFNHSLELNYRLNNAFNLGFIARSRQDDIKSANYILPTFYTRLFSNLSLNGRPDIEGRYLFNAFYQPNRLTRLSFNTYGDAYISDLSYNFARDYQVSFGNEFGGGLSPRYTLSLGHNPSSLRQLSWNLGIAFRDSEVAPTVGASMQVLPGLFARLEYQGIPSRTKGNFGGFGDDRLSISLVSDLSFGGGRIAPANYSGIGKESGAIAGRLVVEGGRKNFDLSGSNIRVLNKRNESVGGTRTDSQGNFFIGNLPEGNYLVELEPDELPIELSVPKTSLVVQVANSAVTKLDFPIKTEYGIAGRVTDIADQPIPQVRVELINAAGIRALSAFTDQNGLYRLDGVPVGKYTLRVSPQDSLNPNDTLPKRQIEIRNEFVYNQNLQLPISAAAKKK